MSVSVPTRTAVDYSLSEINKLELAVPSEANVVRRDVRVGDVCAVALIKGEQQVPGGMSV